MISGPRRGLVDRVILLLSSAPGAGEADPTPDDGQAVDVPFAEDPDEAADEAVISLARAVFAEGGRIAVLRDAEVALLVASVAGEYATARWAEGFGGEEPRPSAPVLFFSNRRADRATTGSGDPLAALARLGYVEFRPGYTAEHVNRLRREVRPAAVVCIRGGDEESRAARALVGDARVYLIATTGGAAAELANSGDQRMTRFDRQVLQQIPDPPDNRPRDAPADVPADVPRWTPYPLILQMLVAELSG